MFLTTAIFSSLANAATLELELDHNSAKTKTQKIEKNGWYSLKLNDADRHYNKESHTITVKGVSEDVLKRNFKNIKEENGNYIFNLEVTTTPSTCGYSEYEDHYYYNFNVSFTHSDISSEQVIKCSPTSISLGSRSGQFIKLL